MAAPKKHQFLPIFYLKQWASENGTIVEYSKPYGDLLKPRRVNPAATGYINRLYAIDGFADELAQEIESEFLSPIDSQAAEAQQLLLFEGSLSSAQRLAWARFIATLMLRMPDDIMNLKASLNELYRSIVPAFEGIYNHVLQNSNDPFDRVSEQVIALSSQHAMLRLREIMSNRRLLDGLLKMEWLTLHVPDYDFITSDRPVIFESPFDDSQGWLACPISPNHVFFAYQNEETRTQIKSADPRKIRSKFNSLIAMSSKRFAYANRDNHLRFIQNRMGTLNSFCLTSNMKNSFSHHIPIVKTQLIKAGKEEILRNLSF
ncbi:DUF4238 domain-containing protein [Brucella sp. NBRC 12950]|uniref:DUF4238 domain-containing protein n=1 Tax=Brucella sp. NBRC 12950 TaxID=2994518 RepID=UPI0024A4DC29|nr:DUF4238 domain-containing protein [Brucella sp. NBRC 12950]GLU26252.1 hypothetical protein Brsp01_14850 [Brucella sp. NBRC 12950]